MDAYTESILASDDIFEYDRILNCFRDNHPVSKSWVIIQLAVNKFNNEENKWCFTNISSEYQWCKRQIDYESLHTVGKKFSRYKSPRNPRRIDEPLWTVNERVINRLEKDGFLIFNEGRTAVYPTPKVYESQKENGMGEIII